MKRHINPSLSSLATLSRGERLVMSFNFKLDTMRNLTLVIAASFIGCTFSIGADALLSRGDSGTKGIVSGIMVSLLIPMIFVAVCVHSWMVYQHGRLIRIHDPKWYLLPAGLLVVTLTPMIVYLILLY